MTDFNDNLDNLLTEEEKPAEAPKPDEAAPDESEETVDSPAEKQPDEEQPVEDEKKTVPLATYLELKNSTREQMREMREHNLQMQQRLDTIEQRTAEATAPAEDDNEPLTRSDLKRMQREQIEKDRQRQTAETTARVRNSLLLADRDQERAITIAERYLSAADRQQIAGADDPLGTAFSLAKARVNAFGTAAEVQWFEKTFPAPQKQAGQPKPKTKPATPPEEEEESGEYAPTAPGLTGGNRELIDHMFG